MQKDSAKNLIKNTLQHSFDKVQFINLIKNIFQKEKKDEKDKPAYENAPFVYTGNYIFDNFADSIESLERIGKYTDKNNKLIDILIVKLKKETTLERARTTQRNFIAKYLNGSRGEDLKDAALVAFVAPNDEDWRFSLVEMDYKLKETPDGKVKVKEAFTPARRYSFLVGKNENSHTAQSRLLPLLLNDEQNLTLDDIEKAFSVESVTKEFFEKYHELFFRLKESMDKIVENDAKIRADFGAKNIDTTNFSKKLLGQIVFLYFLQKKGWFGVARNQEWGAGSKHFLRELFDKKHSDYKNFFNDILEPLFYEALRLERPGDYYSRFDCRIPFLNGGLFDPIGDYDWWNTDILLPNELFSNNKEGDTGDGILDVFDRYNFTVKEDEPLEKEVAIDPEMLGKVFENLLEVKDRKSKGTFYTPREIVHYMCQESLANYLVTELSSVIPSEARNLKDDIETLIKYGEAVVENDIHVISKNRETERYSFKLPESIRTHAKLIDEKLASIRVLDPAIGSGAFPVGMMHEIVKIRRILENTYIPTSKTMYDFKRECIENSLYGVDIDSGAAEIAKLRLWLSLIVDEEDINKIKPLPNLDYKIVQGNSLLSVEKNLFNNELFSQLEQLKPLHFNETSASKKKEYRRQIDKLISQITSGHTAFDFEVYFSEVFHHKKGFDVVMGNPPYIQLQKDGGRLAKLFEKQNFETFARTGDIYALFYEKGLQLLKNNGILTFITSNKWMRAGYGEKTRAFFIKYNPLVLIDLGPGVFESATVDTNILIIQKANNKQKLLAVTLQKDNNIVDITKQLSERGVILNKLTNDAWFIGSSAEQHLKEKIERLGKPLKEWDVKIYRGVLTGLNEAFIIDSQKREEILNNCHDEAERQRTEAIIKPILRGRDIKRYTYEWAELWVIGTFPALHLNIDDYPAIKKYFLDNFDIRQLEQSGKKYPELGFDARKKTGNKWFETQDQIAYYPEFEKEKVVYPNMTKFLPFVYDDKGFFTNQKCFILTGNKKILKFLTAYFNSKISQSWIRNNCPELQGGTRELSWIFMQNLPLPPITAFNQGIVSQIEGLVDKILTVKKQSPTANTQAWEQEIDRLVYKLYGLTEEEIKIIEKK